MLLVVLLFMVCGASAWATSPGRNGSIYFTSDIRSVPGPPSLVEHGYLLGAKGPRLVARCHCYGSFTPNGRELYLEASPGDAVQPKSPARLVDLRTRWVRTLPRLPDQVEFAGAASWSPDGKRLAYTCTKFSIPLRPNYVCVARPDRRGFRRLARGSSPTWSVSGEIAFAHRATGTLGQSLIYVIGRSGRSTRLTDGNVADSAPSWSPDGQRLAFARTDLRAGRETIVTLGRHARTPRMLVPSLPVDNVVGGPIWSPDGKWIAYSTFDGIYEVPAGGGQPRELLAASTFRFPGGNSIRLTPTDWQPLP